MRTMTFRRKKFLLSAVPTLLAGIAAATNLHNFDNQPLVVNATDTGASITMSTAPGVNGRSLQARFDLTAGHWASVALDVEGVDRWALGATGVRFRYRMTGPARALEFELADNDSPLDTACTKIKANLVPTADGDWRTVTIPWGSFGAASGGTGGFDATSITFFNFIISRGAGADGSGAVDLDDVVLVDGGGNVVRVLDDFSLDKPDVVYIEWAEDGQFPLSIVADDTAPGNRVGRFDYTLTGAVNYGGALRALNANLLAEKNLRFSFNGTGANADIEVKLKDIDNTVYVRRLSDVTDTGGAWKTVSLPRESFTFNGLGADALLNLRRIKTIELVFSRGESSTGTVRVDNLETVAPTSIDKQSLGRILTAVVTPANPFSPNGDSRKDDFFVNYTLVEEARMVFRVFGLHGNPVRAVDLGSVAAGAQSILWDGRGDDGRTVQNGMYFFTLEAEGASGKETFRHVVGVVK